MTLVNDQIINRDLFVAIRKALLRQALVKSHLLPLPIARVLQIRKGQLLNHLFKGNAAN